MQNGDQPATLEEALAALARERARADAAERGKTEAELRERRAREEATRLQQENRVLKLDFVTELPVRRVFEGELAAKVRAMLALPEAQRYLQATEFGPTLYPPPHGSDAMNLAVGYADIWLLRHWNNRYSHEQGDKVLRAFADAIRKHAPEWLSAYRSGGRGDEFMWVMNATQPQMAEVGSQIKRTFNTFPVPSGALYIPDFDIGYATIYEALWAYARLITESPRIKRDPRSQLTRIKMLLIKIGERRGRMQKVRARALRLLESMLRGPSFYDTVCEDLYGGTHLFERDIVYLRELNERAVSPMSFNAALDEIAARPQIMEWREARERYSALRERDGAESLIIATEIEAAFHMRPFGRR